jgi:hypothetical protein
MIYEMQLGTWANLSKHVGKETGNESVSHLVVDEWLKTEYGLVAHSLSWRYDVTDEEKLVMFILRWA